MNLYDWCPRFAWCPTRLWVAGEDWRSARKTWLRWVEYRVVGDVAPNDDLTEYWEYRRTRDAARGDNSIVLLIVGFVLLFASSLLLIVLGRH